MGKNRLKAIMMLELEVPHSSDFRALLPLSPVFMSYVLSFIYVGIYWNKLQYGNHPSARDILSNFLWVELSVLRSTCNDNNSPVN